MAARKLRYLALGDSYTIGEGVAECERWPVLLAARLQTMGPAYAGPEIVARTGWTTAELSAAIDRAKPRGPFELVSLLIGVNNQYRGLPLEQYRDEFRGLVQRAIGFAGGRPDQVLVVSIPDWSVSPFAAGRDRGSIARDIDAFNQANRTEAESAGARYADITEISRDVALPGMWAGDGLHPSGAMYRRWVEAILAALAGGKREAAP